MTSTILSSRDSPRGFTLLELVLVMLIVTVLMAMAAPSLHGFYGSRRTAEAAAQIVALTRFARAAAANEGRVYRLYLDSHASAYWLVRQMGTEFVPPASDLGQVFSLPDGIGAKWADEQTPDRQYVHFYPTGRTEAGTIVLTGSQGQRSEIRCESGTEMYRVLKPHELGQP